MLTNNIDAPTTCDSILRPWQLWLFQTAASPFGISDTQWIYYGVFIKDTMYIHADTLSFNSDKSDQHRELKGRHNVRFSAMIFRQMRKYGI